MEPQWLDIQPFLQQVCQELKLGELLHGEAFSLFEAMSALEIGDPKMDRGSVGAVCTLEELLQQNAPLVLTSRHTIAIMDQVLAQEASWHNGGTIVQTLFTCLYLHKPDRLANNNLILYAFCNATLAIAVLVRDLVLKGLACEEEDFLPHKFGLNIDGPGIVPVSQVLPLISMAVDELGVMAKRSTSTPEAGGGAAIDPQYIPALTARLKFRKLLIQILQRFLGCSGKSDLDAAKKLLLSAQSELNILKETAACSEDVELIGFESDINGKLSLPVPPRPLKVFSLADAFDHYRQLLEDLLFVVTVHKVNNWVALKAFMVNFSRRQCSSVCRSVMHWVLSRAHKEGRGVGGSGAEPPWCPGKDMMCSAVYLPPWGKLEDSGVKEFITQSVIAVENWCHVMCLNPARQRRRLRRLLEDLSHLYSHAINSDTSPHMMQLLTSAGWDWRPMDGSGEDIQGALGVWVESESAGMMVQHLMMGFDLDLYAHREMPMIYWYCDYLLGIVQQNAKHVLACSPLRTDSAAHGAKRSAAQHDLHAARNAHMMQIVGLEVERVMCQGIMRAVVGLKMDGKVRSPPPPHNTEEQQFEQRFAAFHILVRPEPLHYSYYSESMDTSGVTASNLYGLSRDVLMGCRNSIRMLTQGALAGDVTAAHQEAYYKKMDNVAMRNIVALNVLINSEATGQASNLSVTWDFSHHPHFPVMQLKNKMTGKT